MRFSPLLAQLIDAFCCLPGVGPKTAQRMAMHLLVRGRGQGKHLAQRLTEAMDNIQHCHYCRNFSEASLCEICASPYRETALLCIVENPMDATAIEQTGCYKGKYFVLLGRLSPLDGTGPEEIGITQLKSYFEQGTITEIILATNPTVEGEATAHYIAELAHTYPIKVTRIARGVAIGSELEYSDASTLSHALAVRETL